MEINPCPLIILFIMAKTPYKPLAHSFVAANAGSGKTTVLVNRLLQLLLRDAMPHEILCLTFTKAAAGEMAERLHTILQRWAVISDEELLKEIARVEGEQATINQLEPARKLFRKVLDAPGGLHLQTIHSFSESLLKRFPIEAGVPPDFTIIEGNEANLLLNNAAKEVIETLTPDTPVFKALTLLFGQMNLNEILSLTRKLASEAVIESDVKPEPESCYQAIEALNQLFSDQSVEKSQSEIDTKLYEQWADHPELKNLAKSLEGESAKYKKKLLGAINSDQQNSDYIHTLADALFTKEKKPIKHLVKLKEEHPVLDKLSDQLENWLDQQHLRDCLEVTTALLTLCPLIWERYRDTKMRLGRLDYEDLILFSEQLLTNIELAWVHFKLDKGLRHILVDEAQDTNPMQWRIIHALSEPFFWQSERDKKERTLFIVGDVKQSIYSFQGVNPQEFMHSETRLEQLAKEADQPYHPKALLKSYRSLPVILQAVDQVLKPQWQALGIRSENSLRHEAARTSLEVSENETSQGRVLVWPPFLNKPTESTSKEKWLVDFTPNLATEDEDAFDARDQLARAITIWIQSRIDTGGYRAGDIMVLVRRRSEFVTVLTRHLLEANIPVSGSDRMVVTQQLAVRDIVAILNWLLDPDDDLTLAIILKSPFCGLEEEALFELAYDRGDSTLYNRLKQHGGYQKILDWLKGFLAKTDFLPPFELIRMLLQSPISTHSNWNGKQALMARLGKACAEPIEAFLDLALHYQSLRDSSLQGFVAWLQEGDTEIKYVKKGDDNELRILTVHNAKGLEAPIVILPEELDAKQPNHKEWQWLKRRDSLSNQIPFRTLPFCVPRKDDHPNLIEPLLTKTDSGEKDEYQRLLYVGMTRAEDELLICGYGNATKEMKCLDDFFAKHQTSWLAQAYQRLSLLIDQEQETKICYIPPPCSADQLSAKSELAENAIEFGTAPMRYQAKEKTKDENTSDKELNNIPIPDWLNKPPQEIAQSRIPLMPSRLNIEADSFAPSPLHGQPEASKSKAGIAKGRIIHQLLDYLPNVPANARQQAISTFLDHHAPTLNIEHHDIIEKEVMGVLSHPDHARFFSNNSVSEVMVKGELVINGKQEMVSGQIDRLVIEQDYVLVIDYKSSAIVPEGLEQLPQSYAKQMRLYRDLVRLCYPQHRVETALIWTQQPKLMVLEDAYLDQVALP